MNTLKSVLAPPHGLKWAGRDTGRRVGGRERGNGTGGWDGDGHEDVEIDRGMPSEGIGSITPYPFPFNIYIPLLY